MPITCHLRPNENLAVTVHVGAISNDEFLEFYKKFYQETISDKIFNQLVDLRRAESSERSPEVLRELATFMQEYFSKSNIRPKIAVIAKKDLSYGMARMFEVYSFPVPLDYRVFRTADDALAWLDAPGDLMNDLEKEAKLEDRSDKK